MSLRTVNAGEAALRAVMDRGLEAAIVNPTGVIGPPDFARSRINEVILAMLHAGLPALVEGGFDWVDVRDVASSMVAAETRARSGENYLLPGHHHSLRSLGAMAAHVAGVRTPPIVIPMWLARMWSLFASAGRRRSGSPLRYTRDSLHALRFNPTVSGVKAKAELGHQPRPTEETVRDLYMWNASSLP